MPDELTIAPPQPPRRRSRLRRPEPEPEPPPPTDGQKRIARIQEMLRVEDERKRKLRIQKIESLLREEDTRRKVLARAPKPPAPEPVDPKVQQLQDARSAFQQEWDKEPKERPATIRPYRPGFEAPVDPNVIARELAATEARIEELMAGARKENRPLTVAEAQAIAPHLGVLVRNHGKERPAPAPNFDAEVGSGDPLEEAKAAIRKRASEGGATEAMLMMAEAKAEDYPALIPFVKDVRDILRAVFGSPEQKAMEYIHDVTERGFPYQPERFKAEQDVIADAILLKYTEAVAKGKVPLGAGVVEGLAISTPFALEFGLTAGIGTVAKLATKKAILAGIKRLVPKYAKELGGELGKKGLTKALAGVGGWLAGGVTQATFGFSQKTAAEVARRMEVKEDGSVGLPKGVNWKEAIATAYGSTLIEVLSEMTGGVIIKGVGKGLRRMAPTVIKQRMAGWLSKIVSPKWQARLKEFALGGEDPTLLHGVLGEMEEEEWGKFARAMTGIDDFNLEGDDNTIWNRFQKALKDHGGNELAANVILFSLMMVPGIAGNRMARWNVARANKRLALTAPGVQEALAALHDQRPGTTDAALRTELQGIEADEATLTERVNALWNVIEAPGVLTDSEARVVVDQWQDSLEEEVPDAEEAGVAVEAPGAQVEAEGGAGEGVRVRDVAEDRVEAVAPEAGQAPVGAASPFPESVVQLPVYHGSDKDDISQFLTEPGKLGESTRASTARLGAFFSEDQDVATTAAFGFSIFGVFDPKSKATLYRTHINLKKPLDIDNISGSERDALEAAFPGIKKAFADASDPFEVLQFIAKARRPGVMLNFADYAAQHGTEKKEAQRIWDEERGHPLYVQWKKENEEYLKTLSESYGQEGLRNLGYDGIVLSTTMDAGETPRKTYVVFDSQNIRIAGKRDLRAPIEPSAPEAGQAPVAAAVQPEGARPPASGLPAQGWRTPVIPGKEKLAAFQSAGLPLGTFFALDEPFGSGAHDVTQAIQVAIPPLTAIYDPDGLLGSPTASLQEEFSRSARTMSIETVQWRQAYADFLQSKGYDAYVRGIDGERTNRELIVFKQPGAPAAVSPPIEPAIPTKPAARAPTYAQNIERIQNRGGYADEKTRTVMQNVFARAKIENIPLRQTVQDMVAAGVKPAYVMEEATLDLYTKQDVEAVLNELFPGILEKMAAPVGPTEEEQVAALRALMAKPKKKSRKRRETPLHPVARFIKDQGGVRPYANKKDREEWKDIPLHLRAQTRKRGPNAGNPPDEMLDLLQHAGLMSPGATWEDVLEIILHPEKMAAGTEFEGFTKKAAEEAKAGPSEELYQEKERQFQERLQAGDPATVREDLLRRAEAGDPDAWEDARALLGEEEDWDALRSLGSGVLGALFGGTPTQAQVVAARAAQTLTTTTNATANEVPAELQMPDPAIEKAHQDAHGIKEPSRWEKMRTAGGNFFGWMRGMLRSQEHLPAGTKDGVDYAIAREVDRLLKAVGRLQVEQAIRTVSAITQSLGAGKMAESRNDLLLFERVLLLRNEIASKQAGQPWRFRWEVLEQKGQDPMQVAQATLAKLEALAAQNPRVTEALEARDKVMAMLVERAVQEDILPPAARRNIPVYFHQMVLTYYEAARALRRGSFVNPKKKSFQRRRKPGEMWDEDYDYNTSYIEAEVAWIGDLFLKSAVTKLSKRLEQEYEIGKRLRTEAAKANAKLIQEVTDREVVGRQKRIVEIEAEIKALAAPRKAELADMEKSLSEQEKARLADARDELAKTLARLKEEDIKRTKDARETEREVYTDRRAKLDHDLANLKNQRSQCARELRVKIKKEKESLKAARVESWKQAEEQLGEKRRHARNEAQSDYKKARNEILGVRGPAYTAAVQSWKAKRDVLLDEADKLRDAINAKAPWLKNTRAIGWMTRNLHDMFRLGTIDISAIANVDPKGLKATPTTDDELDADWFKVLTVLANIPPEDPSPLHQKAKRLALGIFSNIAQRKKAQRARLGTEYVDWMDTIPDGYVSVNLHETSFLYRAVGLPDRILQEIQRKGVAELTKDDLKLAEFFRTYAATWIVPEPLAKYLEQKMAQEEIMKNRDAAGGMGTTLANGLAAGLTGWKVWTLLKPWSLPGYLARNVTGDLDFWVGVQPEILTESLPALRQLTRYYRKGELPSDPVERAMFKRALELDVLGSGFGQSELSSLKDQEQFKRLFQEVQPEQISESLWVRADIKAKRLRHPVDWYFQKARKAQGIQEGVLRYAAFRWYVNAIKSGKAINYGGARREHVETLIRKWGIEEAAAHLSRTNGGDYNDLTVAGSWLRRYLFPFLPWKEINIRRYPRAAWNALTWRNAATLPLRIPLKVIRLAFFLRLGWFAAAQQLWNLFVMDDEEEQLTLADRQSPHLVLGSDATGKTIIWRNIGASTDTAEWAGLNGLLALLAQGRDVSASEYLEVVGEAPVNQLWQLLGPWGKAVETTFGQTRYPYFFSPRSVEWDEHLASTFGMTNLYRWIKGDRPRPLAEGRPWGDFETPIDPIQDRIINFLLTFVMGAQTIDARTASIFRANEIVARWKKKAGLADEAETIYPPSPQRDFLYAVRQDDAGLAEKAYRKNQKRFALKTAEERYESMAKYVDDLNPTDRLTQEHKAQLYRSVSSEERHTLLMASDVARAEKGKFYLMWLDAARRVEGTAAMEEIQHAGQKQIQGIASTLIEDPPPKGMTKITQERRTQWTARRENAIERLKTRGVTAAQVHAAYNVSLDPLPKDLTGAQLNARIAARQRNRTQLDRALKEGGIR